MPLRTSKIDASGMANHTAGKYGQAQPCGAHAIVGIFEHAVRAAPIQPEQSDLFADRTTAAQR
eukprot:11150227-Alexandrium_andersonii.AAC.1